MERFRSEEWERSTIEAILKVDPTEAKRQRVRDRSGGEPPSKTGRARK